MNRKERMKKPAPEQLRAARRYLAHIGGSVKGPCKARTHTGAALKRYWAGVKSGHIARKGYAPKDVDK
jgi:hypothetical protein